MLLHINNLSKSYDKIQALREFTYTLEPGVYGLLGANGSGKSTLMNIISKNLAADSGNIEIEPNMNILGILGYMPQQQSLYRDMTAYAFLQYMASLKKLRNPSNQIDKLLQALNLSSVAHKRMKTYSGGMKQRVLLAQALLGDPRVLLLDEPTAGLDPVERIRIRNLISSFAGDKIVLIATHVVSDIEYIAQEVILLKSGRLLGVRTISDWLLDVEGKVYELLVSEDEVSYYQANYLIANVFYAIGGIMLRVVSDTTPCEEATAVMPTLEDVYLYYNGHESTLLQTGDGAVYAT